MAENFREKFGLDFLKPKAITTAPNRPDDSMSRSLLQFGWQLLSALDKPSPGGEHRLYDLLDSLDISIDIALPIVNEFEKEGLLTVIERDSKGNHKLKITPAGDAFLHSPQP